MVEKTRPTQEDMADPVVQLAAHFMNAVEPIASGHNGRQVCQAMLITTVSMFKHSLHNADSSDAIRACGEELCLMLEHIAEAGEGTVIPLEKIFAAAAKAN